MVDPLFGVVLAKTTLGAGSLIVETGVEMGVLVNEGAGVGFGSRIGGGITIVLTGEATIVGAALLGIDTGTAIGGRPRVETDTGGAGGFGRGN